MRLGVFGGSFDPVHLGHLMLAESCQRHARLERVIFVPAAQQPLKAWAPRAGNADRLAMLELAIAGRPEFAVSTIELDRGGLSYTIDTLRAFRAEQPDAELFFLMGADALADLPHWREASAILDLATPLVMRRPGSPEPNFSVLAPVATADRIAEIRAAMVDAAGSPISSSEIRRLAANGGPWRQLVPARVAEYIESRGLYRT